jgi:hypothetical protein
MGKSKVNFNSYVKLQEGNHSFVDPLGLGNYGISLPSCDSCSHGQNDEKNHGMEWGILSDKSTWQPQNLDKVYPRNMKV